MRRPNSCHENSWNRFVDRGFESGVEIFGKDKDEQLADAKQVEGVRFDIVSR